MTPYVHQVQYYETDRMGITHHSNYIRWMEEARVDFLRQIGWGYDRLEDMGIVSPVTAASCRYLASTTFADRVSITLTVESFNGVTLCLGYTMEKGDGAQVCTGHTEHCFLNREGRFLRLKREFPDFYQALTSLLPPSPAN
ncbi:MAG: acyl-CoA thioesterase [Aristaeellaceae bacterium]